MKGCPNIVMIIIVTFLFSGCCSIAREDFEFNNKELSHFSDYKIGDSIWFQSNRGDIDTITVVAFGTERYDKCGGITQRRPLNSRWVKIMHLPIDKWHGTSRDLSTGGKPEIVHQELLWITKFPSDKTTEYSVSFKDFYSRPDTTIGEYFVNTLVLNDLRFSNYFKVKHGYPGKVNKPKSIKTVYWTDRFGLTAYESEDGEVWTRASRR